MGLGLELLRIYPCAFRWGGVATLCFSVGRRCYHVLQPSMLVELHGLELVHTHMKLVLLLVPSLVSCCKYRYFSLLINVPLLKPIYPSSQLQEPYIYITSSPNHPPTSRSCRLSRIDKTS